MHLFTFFSDNNLSGSMTKDEFMSYKLGIHITWQLNNFDPRGPIGYHDLGTGTLTEENLWNPDSEQDTDALVNTLKNDIGAEFISIRYMHHSGFGLGNSQTRNNNGTPFSSSTSLGTENLPRKTDYNIFNSNVQSNLYPNNTYVSDIRNKCKAEGIKFGLYYSLGQNVNERGYFDTWENSAWGSNFQDDWRLYIDYNKQHITELMNTYDPDFFFWDAIIWHPRPFLDEIYNHVKSVNPNCLTIPDVFKIFSYSE